MNFYVFLVIVHIDGPRYVSALSDAQRRSFYFGSSLTQKRMFRDVDLHMGGGQFRIFSVVLYFTVSYQWLLVDSFYISNYYLDSNTIFV